MKIVSSFFLILILLSSAVLGPMSVSLYYMPVAFAETSDITDVGNYAVYGLEKVKIDKGVTIQSGNIGLHDDSKKKGEIKIKKDVEFNDSESSIVANKIKINKDAIVPNVYYNDLDSKGTILGTENTPLTLPVVINLPDFPDFESGDEKIKVHKNEFVSLPSGDYGKIELKKNSMMIFEGGIYNIESIKADKNSQILFEDPSEIRVEKDVKLKKIVTLGPHPDSEITASDILFLVGDDKKSKIEFGKSSVVHATFFAPEGEIQMKKETLAVGSFVANKIKIDKNANLILNADDIPIGDLVDKYLELIENLDEIGSEIKETEVTQELIDEINDDLDRISQIVIELQMRGYDGEINATRNNSEMIGNVKFFDENTNETLFEIIIPSGALSIFYAFTLIEEFENGGFVHSFEEQAIIINSAPDVVSVISNFNDDEVAGELIVASIGMSHPSTGNTVVQKIINIIVNTLKKTQKSVSNCLSDSQCQDDLFDVLEEFAEDLYESTSFQRVTIPLTKFNDVNGNGTFDSSETGLNNWEFILSVFTPDADPGVPLEIIYSIDTTNADGELTFSEFIPADATQLHVTELLQEGWQFSNPVDGTHTLAYDHNVNSEYDRIFFGNQRTSILSGDVFVSEQSFGAIHKFDTDGNYITTLLDIGESAIRDVEVDSAGNVYASGDFLDDVSNDIFTVAKFDNDLQLLGFFGPQGDPFVTPGTVDFGESVAITSSGDVFVSEQSFGAIHKFDTDGNYITTLLDIGESAIRDVEVDSAGNVYASGDFLDDVSNDIFTVAKFDNDLQLLGFFGPQGDPFVTPGTVDFGESVAITSSGDVFVSEQSFGAIHKFDTDGNYITTLLDIGESAIRDVEVDSAGNVYASGDFLDDVSNDIFTVAKFDNDLQLLGFFGPQGDPFVTPGTVDFGESVAITP